MRLRYFIGVVAAFLFTACSVEVDLEEASTLTVAGMGAHGNEKVFLANGQTGFGVVFDTSGHANVLNGTYELLYLGSDQDNVKLNDYDGGNLDKAYIKYKATNYNAEELGHVYFDYMTDIRVPGTAAVNLNAKPLTQEYTLSWDITGKGEGVSPKAKLVGFPSEFDATTGTPRGNGLVVELLFDVTGGAGGVWYCQSVILPKMSELPSSAQIYLDYDKKYHKLVLSNNTIVIQ